MKYILDTDQVWLLDDFSSVEIERGTIVENVSVAYGYCKFNVVGLDTTLVTCFSHYFIEYTEANIELYKEYLEANNKIKYHQNILYDIFSKMSKL